MTEGEGRGAETVRVRSVAAAPTATGSGVPPRSGATPLSDFDLGGLPPERDAPPLDGRRRIFFTCAIALFMASCDSTIVATALPKIGSALHTQVNWTGWTITIYSLGQILMLPLAGRISDLFGRKNLFIACAVVFTASSVACGLSTDIYMLLPLRFIQSLGGGGFLPSASGIVADHFGNERDRALGLFSSIFPIGSVAGPIFGGIITQYWEWRGIFFVNLPVGIILIALIIRLVPQSAREGNERIDAKGMALLAATLVSGMLAITLLGEPNSTFLSLQFVLPLALAIVFGWFFARHAGRSPAPIIPLRLISGAGFAPMNVLNLLFGGAGFGFGVLIPLYAHNRYHIPLDRAGTILSCQAAGMACVALVASYYLRRTGYRKPMAIGFLIISVALIFLSIGPRGGLSPYWWLALFSLMSGLGLGASAPAGNNATLALAPTQVAAISGIRATFRQSGMILCVSAVTAIVARSAHPGVAQAHMFWVLSAIIAASTLLTLLIPDRKGSW